MTTTQLLALFLLCTHKTSVDPSPLLCYVALGPPQFRGSLKGQRPGACGVANVELSWEAVPAPAGPRWATPHTGLLTALLLEHEHRGHPRGMYNLRSLHLMVTAPPGSHDPQQQGSSCVERSPRAQLQADPGHTSCTLVDSSHRTFTASSCGLLASSAAVHSCSCQIHPPGPGLGF